MADRHQIENFLYREARLMDEHEYEEWLSLWADDALYWVPANRDDIDTSREVSIIYDDRARLEERIARLTSGAAWAQDPPSHLRRMIANVEVEEENGEVMAHSNFNLTEFRRDEQNVYAGRVTHKLRPRDGGGFEIVYKKVALVENDGFLGNLTFLL